MNGQSCPGLTCENVGKYVRSIPLLDNSSASMDITITVRRVQEDGRKPESLALQYGQQVPTLHLQRDTCLKKPIIGRPALPQPCLFSVPTKSVVVILGFT